MDLLVQRSRFNLVAEKMSKHSMSHSSISEEIIYLYGNHIGELPCNTELLHKYVNENTWVIYGCPFAQKLFPYIYRTFCDLYKENEISYIIFLWRI